MQLVNIFDQEVLIEYVQNDINLISNFIETCEETEGNECYIFDSKQRIYSSYYISHSIIRNEMEKIYQIFFKAELSKDCVC